MAKKRKAVDADKEADDISSLLELAQKRNLSDGVFDDNVCDECRVESKLQAENINSGSLMEQLEFLYQHGYSLARLRQLIEEYSE